MSMSETGNVPSLDQLTDVYGYIGRGEFIVVLDSQDRENEGDLIIAAEAITTEKMAFMIRYTRYNSYAENILF